MGKNKLYILRGLPGSGKSTEAKRMLDDGEVTSHYEADMFFVNGEGEYVFDHSWIKSAHAWCQRSVEDALVAGESVVVSNTFVKRWEMEFYVQLAKRVGADCVIITCVGNWPNLHGVPPHVIERMTDTWEL